MAHVSESVGRKARKPAPAMEALKRRLGEGAGVALIFASLLLAVALASYDRADPSPSHAIAGPVRNIVGPAGADIADVLLQTMGLAAALIPAVLVAWAFRLMLSRGVDKLVLRLALFLPLLALAAIALHLLPPGEHWPIHAGLGGIVGRMGLEALVHTGLPEPAAAMGAAAVDGLLLVYVLGLTLEDWGDIGRGASRTARISARIAGWLRPRVDAQRERAEPAVAVERRRPAPVDLVEKPESGKG